MRARRVLLLLTLLLQALAIWNPAGAGEEQAPDSAYLRLLVATCYTCHSGADHEGAAIPRIEGLAQARVRELLTAFKTDTERVTIMNRISKALTDAEIDRVSAMLSREER